MHGNYGEEVCVVALGFAAIKLGNKRALKRREKEELNDTAHSQGSHRRSGLKENRESEMLCFGKEREGKPERKRRFEGIYDERAIAVGIFSGDERERRREAKLLCQRKSVCEREQLGYFIGTFIHTLDTVALSTVCSDS